MTDKLEKPELQLAADELDSPLPTLLARTCTPTRARTCMGTHARAHAGWRLVAPGLIQGPNDVIMESDLDFHSKSLALPRRPGSCGRGKPLALSKAKGNQQGPHTPTPPPRKSLPADCSLTLHNWRMQAPTSGSWDGVRPADGDEGSSQTWLSS